MARRLIDVLDRFNRQAYTPVLYNRNEEVERFQKDGGDLDRLIHETGVKVIFEGITDISKIDFYTLSQEEKNKVWSEIARRMRVCNSPFPYALHSDGIVRSIMSGAGAFNPYEGIAKSSLEAEKIFNQVIIDCYTKASDTEGMKDFAKELRGRGFIEGAEKIENRFKELKL